MVRPGFVRFVPTPRAREAQAATDLWHPARCVATGQQMELRKRFPEQATGSASLQVLVVRLEERLADRITLAQRGGGRRYAALGRSRAHLDRDRAALSRVSAGVGVGVAGGNPSFRLGLRFRH